MKYAGIGCVLIDWYGSHKVHDYGPNLDNSEALIGKMGAIGILGWNTLKLFSWSEAVAHLTASIGIDRLNMPELYRWKSSENPYVSCLAFPVAIGYVYRTIFVMLIDSISIYLGDYWRCTVGIYDRI